jgi:histidine triad (HIT) family protein
MTDCIFCKIVAGEIPCKKVYEDKNSLAFLDINPRNPGHALVIPKKHIQDIFSISEGEASELIKTVRRVAIGVRKAVDAKGISITQSNGQLAGQLVPHMHFHVIPRTEAEKGLGLEGVLPVKQEEEAAMDSMARKIASSIPKGGPAEPKPSESEKPETPKEEPKKKAPVAKRPDTPEKQDINFDF